VLEEHPQLLKINRRGFNTTPRLLTKLICQLSYAYRNGVPGFSMNKGRGIVLNC
jgi:hypothetical protein